MIQEPITDQHGESPSVERGKTLSSTALLAAWREYSGNPYAMHPCENFKAGWVARKLTEESGTVTEAAIKNGCRDFRC